MDLNNSMKAGLLLFIISSPMLVLSVSCKSDDDCLSLNTCVKGTCTHKQFLPLQGTEWGGTIALMIVAVIANSGGIGGSVISTAINLSLFFFDAHQAVAMTQCFIFAGSFTSAMLKIRDRHPTRDRPLIYYDVLLQLSSPLLLGLSMGVLTNSVFPDWLILALITIIIIYLIIATLRKAVELFKIETKLKERAHIKEEQHKLKEIKEIPKEIRGNMGNTDIGERPVLLESANNEESPEKRDEFQDENKGNSEGIDSDDRIIEVETKMIISETIDKYQDLPEGLKADILEIERDEQKKFLLSPHMTYFMLVIGCSILFKLLLSTKTILTIKSCSPQFYVIIFCYIIVMLVLNLYSSYYLIRKTRICEQANYEFEDDDIKWNPRRCLHFLITWTVIGFLVGVLGLGGVVINPGLLFLQIRPEISTISSSFTIAISAFTAMMQFFIAGTIDYKYALWLMGFSSFGALNGILILRRQFLKWKRSSLLIFAYCAIVIGTLVVIPAVEVVTAIKQAHDGNFVIGFTPIC